MESLGQLRRSGATVAVAMCVIDRDAGGAANLASVDVDLRSLFRTSDLRSASG